MEAAQALPIAQPAEYLLSAVSSTSAIITRFVRAVRVAHADLAAVTRELSDLRLLLELLKEESAIPAILQTHVLRVLESCGEVLIHIDVILARCSEPGQWKESGSKEMGSCRDRLGTCREALSLALDVSSLYVVPGAA